MNDPQLCDTPQTFPNGDYNARPHDASTQYPGQRLGDVSQHGWRQGIAADVFGEHLTALPTQPQLMQPRYRELPFFQPGQQSVGGVE